MKASKSEGRRRADFEVFPIRVRPKSSPEGRLLAREQYCVTKGSRQAAQNRRLRGHNGVHRGRNWAELFRSLKVLVRGRNTPEPVRIRSESDCVGCGHRPGHFGFGFVRLMGPSWAPKSQIFGRILESFPGPFGSAEERGFIGALTSIFSGSLTGPIPGGPWAAKRLKIDNSGAMFSSHVGRRIGA